MCGVLCPGVLAALAAAHHWQVSAIDLRCLQEVMDVAVRDVGHGWCVVTALLYQPLLTSVQTLCYCTNRLRLEAVRHKFISQVDFEDISCRIQQSC